MPSSSSFALPDELWIMIFCYLDDFAGLSLVCKRFCVLSRPSFFRFVRLYPARWAHDHIQPPLSRLFITSPHLSRHVRQMELPNPDNLSAAHSDEYGPAYSDVPTVFVSMTNLKVVELYCVELSPALTDALSHLPSLSSLRAVECVSSNPFTLQFLRAQRIPVESLIVSFYDGKNEQCAAALLSAACTEKLKHLTCTPHVGILDVMRIRLAPSSLEYLCFSDVLKVDEGILLNILNSQPNIQHLRSVHLFDDLLPSACLPRVQEIQDMPVNQFFPGRPIQTLTGSWGWFSGGRKNDEPRELFPQSTLQAIRLSSVPLRRLVLRDVPQFDEALLNQMVDSFPSLEALSMSLESHTGETFLQHSLKAKLPSWPCLKSLSLSRTLAFNAIVDSAWAFGLSEAQLEKRDQWQWKLILEWEAVSPTLRQVALQRNEWIRLNRGEWRGYDSDSRPERVIMMKAVAL